MLDARRRACQTAATRLPRRAPLRGSRAGPRGARARRISRRARRRGASGSGSGGSRDRLGAPPPRGARPARRDATPKEFLDGGRVLEEPRAALQEDGARRVHAESGPTLRAHPEVRDDRVGAHVARLVLDVLGHGLDAPVGDQGVDRSGQGPAVAAKCCEEAGALAALAGDEGVDLLAERLRLLPGKLDLTVPLRRHPGPPAPAESSP